MCILFNVAMPPKGKKVPALQPCTQRKCTSGDHSRPRAWRLGHLHVCRLCIVTWTLACLSHSAPHSHSHCPCHSHHTSHWLAPNTLGIVGAARESRERELEIGQISEAVFLKFNDDSLKHMGKRLNGRPNSNQGGL